MEREIKERIETGRQIARQRLGLSSPEEEERLKAWLSEDERHRRLYERLSREEIDTSDLSSEGERQWDTFTKRLSARRRAGTRRLTGWLSAACVLLLMAAGTFYWLRDNQNEIQIIPPRPTNEVQLVLGDGQSVSLGQEESEELARFEGIEVETRTQSIDYSAMREKGDSAVEYHTIIVPKYGEYSVRLSDNTVVKLNSESTLRYPVAFRGRTRDIWLTGEAYLEVAKDSAHRFRVHAGGTTVSVLGTIFNVANDAKNRQTATTLVSGSVSVDNGKESRLILPGQQAVAREDGSGITVRQADIAAVTAWTRDMFYFREEPLEKIMNTLANWYEFQVIFENESVKQRRFTVESSRYEEIDKILTLIEETGVVTCRKEGQTIHIQ